LCGRAGRAVRLFGWRIDYFLASESLLPSIKNTFILEDITGSDHCPVGIVFKLYKPKLPNQVIQTALNISTL